MGENLPRDSLFFGMFLSYILLKFKNHSKIAMVVKRLSIHPPILDLSIFEENQIKIGSFEGLKL